MKRPAYSLPLLACTLALGACAKGPEQLASNIKQAIDKKDVDTLLAQADLKQAPAMAIFALIDLPDDCAAPMICTVSIKPADEAWQKDAAQRLEQQQAEWRMKPEGVLVIEGKPDSAVPAQNGAARSLKVQMPYAQVDGSYKLILARYTAARLAELKATTAQAAADATLSHGIGSSTSTARDLDFKGKATALPAGGGDAGAAYLAMVAKVGAAVKAKDVDALAAAKGQWGAAVLGAKDYAGNEIPSDKRERKMRAQSMRLLVAAQVLGGYELGDQAVLVIEGTNGAGGTVRGAQLMERRDGVWEESGSELLEIPAGS